MCLLGDEWGIWLIEYILKILGGWGFSLLKVNLKVWVLLTKGTKISKL